MDLSNSFTDDHSRTIIHIDIDCFYAQVEMVKNPLLADKPLAVKQKSILVTSNHLARRFGVTKCIQISEALKACPELVIVNGEDLHDYRQMSYKITEYLQTLTPMVERLGLDENYIDVSEIVNKRLDSGDCVNTVGNIFGDDKEDCLCGCYKRIQIGSILAQEIRDNIFSKFKLTTCAGIAHNKLLAKLVGSKNRPNKQTLVLPDCALELVSTLGDVGSLTSIGRATADKMLTINVRTVIDLQNCNEKLLFATFGADKAKLFQMIANGVDAGPVKSSGKPQSIGLEDSLSSHNTITAEAQVRTKLDQLLRRLMVLVAEDGRVPRTVKLTVRKLHGQTRVSHRETRQCALSAALFACKAGGAVEWKDAHAHGKVLAVVMGSLFSKVVDVRRPFHVTLLGLSFTKFQETGRLSTPSLPFVRTTSPTFLCGPSSSKASAPLALRRTARSISPLRSFLNKNVVEVQTVTSIENRAQLEQQRHTQLRDESMEFTTGNCSNSSEYCGFYTDGSESEVEAPSPKKAKFVGIVAKRRCGSSSAIGNLNGTDCPSPSKLKVAELRLNSKEYDCDGNKRLDYEDIAQNVKCPPTADVTVFQELPLEMQRELWEEYKRDRDREQQRCHPVIKKAKVNTILNYLVKN